MAPIECTFWAAPAPPSSSMYLSTIRSASIALAISTAFEPGDADEPTAAAEPGGWSLAPSPLEEDDFGITQAAATTKRNNVAINGIARALAAILPPSPVTFRVSVG